MAGLLNKKIPPSIETHGLNRGNTEDVRVQTVTGPEATCRTYQRLGFWLMQICSAGGQHSWRYSRRKMIRGDFFGERSWNLSVRADLCKLCLTQGSDYSPLVNMCLQPTLGKKKKNAMRFGPSENEWESGRERKTRDVMQHDFIFFPNCRLLLTIAGGFLLISVTNSTHLLLSLKNRISTQFITVILTKIHRGLVGFYIH